MNGVLIALSYIFSGFFMKVSDDFYDEKNNKLKAILFGIICGVVTAFVASFNLDAACIFIAILVGNILAFKVDGIHHVMTMLSFIVLFIMMGFPSFSILSIVVIIVSMIGAIADELGNDNEKIYNLGVFFEYFFEYRCTLKLFIFILALIGLLNPWTFIYFILFECAYEFGGYFFKKYLLQ